MEKLISKETAELAKKKGFPFESLEYRDSKTLKLVSNWKERLEYFESEKESGLIQLPTQYALKNWIRLNYNLELEVYRTMGFQYGCEGSLWLEENGEDYSEDLFNFYDEDYETVFEKGLYEALKIINKP